MEEERKGRKCQRKNERRKGIKGKGKKGKFKGRMRN